MEKDLELFRRLANKLFEAEATDPVVDPIPVDELHHKLDLRLEENPATEDYFEKTLEQLILQTPRTATKRFFNQLFGGRQPKATLGDLLSVLLNNSMYTYKVAGPQVGVEKEILHQICNLIGYGKASDGTFAPGGSMSNFMAMLMARDAANLDIRTTGVTQKLTLYTSEASHYSIPKNAAFIGVGREQVRYIKTDSEGRMQPRELEKVLQQDLKDGFTPFFVNATAGTTVLGAFDPINPLADICEAHNIWLHVDGANCGGVIFSEKYKHLVDGIERTNSFSINAHKMLGTPLSCSIIVTQDKKDLNNSFSNDAAYLYQTDGDDYNLGKTSIQCGRRNDALKLWTLWKSIGTSGLKQLVDRQFDLATTALNYVRNHPDYTVYSFEDSISVCFNYKGIPARELCTALYESGALLVGFGSFQGTDFVRLVTINGTNSETEILNFFKILETYVAENASLFKAEVLQK